MELLRRLQKMLGTQQRVTQLAAGVVSVNRALVGQLACLRVQLHPYLLRQRIEVLHRPLDVMQRRRQWEAGVGIQRCYIHSQWQGTLACKRSRWPC